MSARRVAAHRFTPAPPVPPSRSPAWVAPLRDEWLDWGLRAEPADRATAESAVIDLHRLVGIAQPDFHWVPSPVAGSNLITREGLSIGNGANHLTSVQAKLAHLIAGSRRRITAEANAMTGAADDVHRKLHADLVAPLRTSLLDGVAVATRTLMPLTTGRVTWYGQHEAHNVAYLQALERLSLANLSRRDSQLLELQALLTRSTGWWWACNGVCVMSERPIALHTERTPSGSKNERRLHNDSGKALEFADGSGTFVQHGTIVPDWVVLDPSVERINKERSVEVRRTAIERLGWDRFVHNAGLSLIDEAPDPGNTAYRLALYATPPKWRGGGSILLAVNGSVERDGTRRRYGLTVPRHFTSALDAAAWTYGLRGTQYAKLARRT